MPSRRPGRTPARHPLTLLLAALVAVFVVVSIGTPLLGLKAFHSTDLLQSFAPWKQAAPAGYAPDNRCVSDTVDSVLPGRVEFARQLRSGDVALWSPYASGGTTLGAVPDLGLLTPQYLPYLLLPAWLAPGFSKLVEMAVSIGFAVLFLRRLGLSRPAGLLGGLLFTASGFMVVWTNWPQTGVAAFVPALFWAVERLVQLRTPRSGAALAVVVALMLLGGFPAVTALALYAAGAYLLVRLLATGGLGRSVRPALGAGLAIALGVGLAMVQLLPFALRLGGLELDRVNTPDSHLPLQALITAAVPNAFGSCADPAHFYFGPGNQIEAQSAFGTAGLVLVVLAVLLRRPDRVPLGVRSYFLGLVVVVVLLGFVGGTPLALAQQLPTVDASYIGRIRVLLGFGLAVLAALGFEALLRSSRRPPSRRALVVGLVTWLGLAVVALAAVRSVRASADAAGQLDYTDRQVLLALACAAVALAAAAIARLRPHRRTLALGVLAVVAAGQSLLFAESFWPKVPREQFYPETATHAFLREELGEDRYASAGFTMFPGTNVYYALRSVTGHAFTTPEYGDLLRAVDPDVFASTTFSRFVGRADTPLSPVLDRLATRYYVAGPEAGPIGRVTSTAVTGTRPWAPGERLSVALPDGALTDGALRGVGLALPSGWQADDDTARVELTVRDAQDQVVATASRRLHAAVPTGPFVVAVAGEQLAGRAGLSAELLLRSGGSRPVEIGLAGQGPAVTVVTDPGDGLRLVRTGEASVYERSTALPRIRWASTARVVQDPAERLALLAGTPAAGGGVVLSEPGPVGEGRPAEVDVEVDDVDRIVVRVRAEGAGHLVVADSLGTGWQAEVDGEAAPLVEADHAFGAVSLPAGESVVTLVYDPAGVPGGAGASLLALGGLGLLWRGRRPGLRTRVAPADTAEDSPRR